MSAVVRELPFARCIVISLKERSGIDRLTPRQLEVLRAVCRDGHDAGSDAVYLELSTVKEHLRLIYRKLGLAAKGDSRSKIGRSCYQLGVYDRAEDRSS